VREAKKERELALRIECSCAWAMVPLRGWLLSTGAALVRVSRRCAYRSCRMHCVGPLCSRICISRVGPQTGV